MNKWSALFLSMFFLTVACGAFQPIVNVMSTTIAGKACPTPTPMLYGEDGPPKSVRTLPTTVPVGPVETEIEYYEIWEQEYAELGGPPFPAPTPYTRMGMNHHLGEIINTSGGQLDVTVTTNPTGEMLGSDRLHEVHLTWYNHSDQEIPFDVFRHLAITAMALPDGSTQGGEWRPDIALVQDTGLITETTVTMIPVQADPYVMTLPIPAPDGTAETVKIFFDAMSADGQVDDLLSIQFTQGDDPNCDHPGTIAAVYEDEMKPMAPIANVGEVDAVIAYALAHAERQTPYCWGGKGNVACAGNPHPDVNYRDACPAYQNLPCYDCSGLTWGAYQQINVNIHHGTDNQQNHPQVRIADLASGDLAFFGGINQNGRGRVITHVGLVHDVDRDGSWDLIHAAQYPDGTIITYGFLDNPFYFNWFVKATRPARVM